MKRSDEVTVDVERFAAEGKGIARVDGRVMFIKGGVPGDKIRARLTRIKKNFLEGTVLEVLSPSPLRLAPRCRYFGACGGCTWQHVQYQTQLDFKRQQVIEALEHIGGFTGFQTQPTLGSEE